MNILKCQTYLMSHLCENYFHGTFISPIKSCFLDKLWDLTFANFAVISASKEFKRVNFNFGGRLILVEKS